MKIEEVTNKTEWDNFARVYRPSSMLQSWAWGEFAKKQGHPVYRLGLYKDRQLIGATLAVVIRSKRANYIETHMGPMVDYTDVSTFKYFHDQLVEIARDEKLHFVRFRAPLIKDEDKRVTFQRLGYRQAPMYFQAEHTYRLDLRKEEDDLLKSMKKNTRYYVRKAEQAGLKLEISKNREDIKIFFNLYQKTVERQEFVPYDMKFFLDEFDIFHEDDGIEMVFVGNTEQILSAAIIVYYADTAYYHHGGSIRVDPDVFASYLVQWEAIKRAKQNGLLIYDFFGVAPNDDPNHPRAGLTKFKRGFGGERTQFMHTMDFPINKLRYIPTYLYVKYEKWRRGL